MKNKVLFLAAREP